MRILALLALAMHLASPALAAEKKTIVANSPVPISVEAPKGGSEINIIVYPPDTSTAPSNGTETPDYVSNALSIAQSAQSSMSNTLTALAIIISIVALGIAVLIARGFFDLRAISEIHALKDKLKGHVDDAEEQAKKLNALHEDVSKKAKEIASNPDKDALSDSDRVVLDKAASSLELLEVLGQKLTVDDYYSLAYDYALKGNSDKANNLYDKVLEIKPNSHEALYNKGTALSKLGRHDDAIVAYDKALAIKPDKHEALNNKGITLLKLGRHDDAIVTFGKALTIKPDKHSALFNRSCGYALKGERDLALSDLKRAIELDEKYRAGARKDEDFESLRGDPEFRALVGLGEEGGAEDTDSP